MTRTRLEEMMRRQRRELMTDALLAAAATAGVASSLWSLAQMW